MPPQAPHAVLNKKNKKSDCAILRLGERGAFTSWKRTRMKSFSEMEGRNGEMDGLQEDSAMVREMCTREVA